jgi:hypothetical protein
MHCVKVALGGLVAAVLLAGIVSLTLAPAVASPPDFCPQPSGPPGLDCRGCPTFVDPVVCTVICTGGPTQMTFSNQCFASCSGFIISGECTRTGG